MLARIHYADEVGDMVKEELREIQDAVKREEENTTRDKLKAFFTWKAIHR